MSVPSWPFTILQVCLGNICRSPMAERLLVRAAREHVGDRLDELLLVWGAGIAGWHVGEPMEAAAARQVRTRGGDPGGFAARQVDRGIVEASDLILVATGEHQDFADREYPDAAERTFLLRHFGRLLPDALGAPLPPVEQTTAGVYARGTALVAAVARVRRADPARAGDDLADPWGRGEAYFGRVAAQIDACVRPLARALLRG